jgi:hypothetical protein
MTTVEPKNPQKQIPDLLLERYLLGEVSPAEKERVQQALAFDPHVRERLAALEESSKKILAEYPARVTVAGVAARMQHRPRYRRRFNPAWLGAPVAAAAALVLYVVADHGSSKRTPRTEPALPPQKVEEKVETTRVKGDPRLLVYRQGDLDPVELESGATAAPGDLIQLKVLAGEAKHGVVVSIDGRGSVTLHFPEDEGGSTLLDPRGAQPLPRAYELDDAPSFEVFFMVIADDPIDVGAVLQAAEALGPAAGEGLPLPGDWQAVRFLLLKQEAPQ